MWNSIVGFFSDDPLGKLVIILTTATVAIDRAAAVVDKIMAIVNMLRQRGEDKAAQAIEDAIVLTAKAAGTKLDGKNDLTQEKGDALLTKAVQTAVALGAARGTNVEKILGGTEGVEAATQSAFKRIKAALTPGK